MGDPQSTPVDDDGPSADDADAGDTEEGAGEPDASLSDAAESLSTDELRREVERTYDFESFGPDQMAEMSADEWEAAFDPDTWITGQALLDRVEADLKNRVLRRDVFARVERLADGRVLAYSDEGYAAVDPDGSVEGFGTVLRDVKPIVALCSMDSYDVDDAPDGEILPQPEDVPDGGGELGNLVLQVIAGVQVLAGATLLLAWLLFATGLFQRPGTGSQEVNLIVMVVAGLAFLVIGTVLFTVVANARLSDRFRSEEYRDRLRAIGVGSGDRPDFLPVEGNRWVGDDADRGPEAGDGSRVGERETDDR